MNLKSKGHGCAPTCVLTFDCLFACALYVACNCCSAIAAVVCAAVLEHDGLYSYYTILYYTVLYYTILYSVYIYLSNLS